MKKLKAILLVDDDYVCSWLNKSLIEELQVVEIIECIYDGKAALEYLTKVTATKEHMMQSCPDIIFLDIKMPDIDGFDFLDRLNEIESCKDLPRRIVVLSSSMHPVDMSRAANYDIHSYLVKPLTKTKALEIIRDFQNESLEPSEG